jgi:hypothetical protein
MKPVGPRIRQRSFREVCFRLRFDGKISEIAARKAISAGTLMVQRVEKMASAREKRP